MGLLYTREFSPNHNGGNLYFGPEFIRQFGSPLTPGDRVVAQLLPHTAIVLYPAETTVEWPLTVPHPTSIDPATDLSEHPIQCQPDHPTNDV